MKRRFVVFALAAFIAVIVSLVSETVPLEQKLIRIHITERLGDFSGIEQESLDLQAVLADMAYDPLLVLRAKTALLRYRDMSRQLLPMYGAEPEFQDILRQHGESILPAIQFFVLNPVGSIEWMSKAGKHYEAIKRWFADQNGDLAANNDTQSLSPSERGWYAIQYIQAEGHDFIGQFLVTPEGEVEWLVSERVLEGVNQFFGGGLRQLEKRYRMNEQIKASDIGWASLDVLVFASAVKVLRVGRTVAVGTRTASRGTRSAALTARLIGGGRLVLSGARYAKWPLMIGGAYLVITHPSLINDFLAEVAELFGVPPMLLQFFAWLLLLVPVLYLLHALLWLISPLLQAGLWGIGRSLALVSGRQGDGAFLHHYIERVRKSAQQVVFRLRNWK